ncbi:MAG: hypothetical protein K2Y37_01455 [Pirellulales bacterium]|nr:hypothetical protein [Pirellulales bacterium]
MRAGSLLRALLIGLVFAIGLFAARARADVLMPIPDAREPLSITARAAQRWVQGAYDVWVLSGDCELRQGQTVARSEEAVLWISQEEGPAGQPLSRVSTYLEGNVAIEFVDAEGRAEVKSASWLGEFVSTRTLRFDTPPPRVEPQQKPPVYLRGHARRTPKPWASIRQAQFNQPAADPPMPIAAPVPGAAPPVAQPPIAPPADAAVAPAPGPVSVAPEEAAPPAGGRPPITPRRVRVVPRSTVPMRIKWFPSSTGMEWIGTIDNGVRVLVDGLPGVGVLDIAADRVVVWTAGAAEPNLLAETLQSDDVPLELYVEGNIVFREGDRVVYADRMYYNVPNEHGVVIKAELLTPVPEYAGMLKLKSEILRITGRDRFVAQQSYLTSSRLASPGYRLQAGEIFVEDLQRPRVDPASGAVMLNPETGEPMVDHQRLATSRNNLAFLGPVPVFYWPTLATDLTEPSFYLRRILFRNDRIFGTQLLTSFDTYQLLGIRNKPAGTDWLLNGDYFSKRGPAGGTSFFYSRQNLFGLDGPASGLLDAWGIYDTGIDNLGLNRRSITFPHPMRGRVLGRHRQLLPGDWQLTGQVGYISDFNFLEQYYEKEWDEFKDPSTGLELKRLRDNRSLNLETDVRLNPFFTEPNWLPKVDHYWLGQPLLGDWLTWYEHSTAAYGQLRVSAPPTDPNDADQWHLLPWEQPRRGERLITRQEIDLPLNLGPLKVVPYGLGEAAHWGASLNDSNFNRLYGQAGVRAALPFWSSNPNVESTLFNVHGLAHKVALETDFSWADSSQSVTDLPLYERIDDNNILLFRRRFIDTTFGIPPNMVNNASPFFIPPQFDERLYAVRYGLASNVTSPSLEIADTLATGRLNLRQRLQTKRGLPGQRRIIDWMLFDTGVVWFPNPGRDNFGEPFGLLNYDYRWNVGDRFSLVSDGIFDFFTQGQQIVSVGGFLTRPPRGNLYVGLRMLRGPYVPGALQAFKADVLTASYSYLLSPKWLSSAGASLDLRGRNIGQNFTLTRIGESFLMSLGVTVDASKNNVGGTIMVEPRFLPTSRARGMRVPVAGAFGLE